MAELIVKEAFACELEKAWDTVTSLAEYSWRSDVDRIEVLEDGKRFIEHTKDGYSTEFSITVWEPCKRYAFNMENENMKGYWIGTFSYQDGVTTIEFTEGVTAKKLIMKPVAGMYLKKQQKNYIADLKKALEE